MTPSELENLIECYRVIGTHEPDGELRREAFKRMGELIKCRSPQRVEEMEIISGLRK